MTADSVPFLSASCERKEVVYDQIGVLHASANIKVPSTQSSGHLDTAPLSLVAVIDVSSSMHGERMELAKQTLSFMINQLKPQDSFAIVTFGATATIILPLTVMNQRNQRNATKLAKSIRANGCTALSAGLFAGLACFQRVEPDSNCAVMLMTDGHANRGIRTADALVNQLEKELAVFSSEISVYTFGYGFDHNASFLRAIADHTNGMYYFIDRANQIGSAFAECLGGVASVATRSVSLQFIPEDDVIVKKVFSDSVTKREGRMRSIELGNLSQGEHRNIPLQLYFKKIKNPRKALLALTIVVTYVTMTGSQRAVAEVYIARPREEEYSEAITDDFIQIDEQKNRILVAKTLKEVITLGESGDLVEGRNELDLLVHKLLDSVSRSSTFTQHLIEDVKYAVDTLRDSETFKQKGVKYLYSLSRSHYQQRASGVSSAAASSYLTEGQINMLHTLHGTKPAIIAPEVKKKVIEVEANVTVSKGRLGRGVRRLIADLAEIKKHPLPSVTAEPLHSDLFEWHCNMEGPIGSPYHKVIFHVIMQFPHTYPFQPPKLYFCSYLRHENVFRTWICLDMLQEFEWSSSEEKDTPYTGWTTAYSVHSVLLQLQSFLFDKADLSLEEITKATEAAQRFQCTTCPHKGNLSAEHWPQLVKPSPKKNGTDTHLSTDDIPLATISLNPKPFIQHTSQIVPIVPVVPIILPISTPILKKPSTKNGGGWSVVSKQGKKKMVLQEVSSRKEGNVVPLTASQKKNAKRRRRMKEKAQLVKEKEIVPKDVSLIDDLTMHFDELTPMKEMESKNSSLLLDLPNPVILEILSYLPVSDMVIVSQTCRMLYHNSTNRSLWRSLCFRYFPTSNISKEREEENKNKEIHPKIRFAREVTGAKKQIFCFHTRKTFGEDILGIPISFTRNIRTKKIQFISTTFDLLSKEAFEDDQVRKSVWKRPFTNWLPLYITRNHAERGLNDVEQSIATLCDARFFSPWMVVDVLPKLMSTMVVSVMSGETHASMVAIEGYCAFHHLFLKMIERYPQLVKRIDSTIANFIREDQYRMKEYTPSLGEFIPLLAVSEKYHWNDVRSAFLQESFDRNSLWIIKQFPGLKYSDKGYAQKDFVNKERLLNSFEATITSKRLLMFHVYFLSNIARPDGRSLREVTANYDLCYGRPTAQMKEDLQNYCKGVIAVDNWQGFFMKMKMKVPTAKFVTFVLNQAVVNSKRKGYHY